VELHFHSPLAFTPFTWTNVPTIGINASALRNEGKQATSGKKVALVPVLNAYVEASTAATANIEYLLFIYLVKSLFIIYSTSIYSFAVRFSAL
jgi:hypothetical protein